jgi:hypothetical protein
MFYCLFKKKGHLRTTDKEEELIIPAALCKLRVKN